MDRNRDLAKLLVQRSYVEGDFLLASGRRSTSYFDCKLTTCFAEAMPLIGAAFIEITAGHHRPEARHLYESLGYDGSVAAYLRKKL